MKVNENWKLNNTSGFSENCKFNENSKEAQVLTWLSLPWENMTIGNEDRDTEIKVNDTISIQIPDYEYGVFVATKDTLTLVGTYRELIGTLNSL